MTLENDAGDPVAEFLTVADAEGTAVPSDATLQLLIGLDRDDARAVASHIGGWPDDVGLATVERLYEMARTGRASGFDELFYALMSHPQDAVRSNAVAAITGNGDSQLIGQLTLMLRTDMSDAVRARAAAALGAFAEAAESGRISARRTASVRDTLLAASDDATRSVAGQALVAYAGMPGGSPTEAIESWLELYGDDPEGLAFGCAAMGRSNQRHWLEDVRDALDHQSSIVRIAAALAFGELVDPDDSLDPLLALLDDESLEVQLAAVDALGMIGSNEARKLLGDAASESPEPDVKARAEAALRQLREDDDLRHAVTPDMMASGLYGGGGTATPQRDIGRYDAPTEEGWGWDDADDSGAPADDERDSDADDASEDEDIGEDLEDYYDTDEFHRSMN